MKIDDIVEHYLSRGYYIINYTRDRKHYNMICDNFSHRLTVIENSGITTVQISITINSFMGSVKSWEFVYPNSKIDKLIKKILEIKS